MSIRDLPLGDTTNSQNPLSEAPDAASDSFDHAEIDPAKPNPLLTTADLSVLNVRSNWKGYGQLCGHLSIMGGSGYLWATYGAMGDRWYVALPALVVYGFSLASMFAPLHECVHRTAFADNRTNDIVAWFAGLLSFYNSTFYRRYHKWHHRYAQIPDKDPELSDPKPSNWWEYCVELSGWTWWIGKVRGHVRVAMGQLENCPFIAESARAEAARSTKLQLLVYALAIGISITFRQPWFLLYWLLPLAIRQPILRAILLAEHTGCTYDGNPLTNTRTTLTIAPIRFLMWNMPFHAEHHLYASIPFHALPTAHEKLRTHLTCIASGYVSAHRAIATGLSKSDKTAAA